MASLATEVQILEDHVDSHDGTFINLARIKLEVLRQKKKIERREASLGRRRWGKVFDILSKVKNLGNDGIKGRNSVALQLSIYVCFVLRGCGVHASAHKNEMQVYNTLKK